MPLPADDPRTELILSNIATAITAITISNGFWTDVETVLRRLIEIEEESDSGRAPIAMIVGGDRTRSRLGNDGLFLVSFEAIVWLGVYNNDEDGDLSIEAERFIGDVERKLAEDPHRGTLSGGGFVARDSWVSKVETFEGILTPWEIVKMTITNEYSHRADSP